jgi:sugar phosphate permease
VLQRELGLELAETGLVIGAVNIGALLALLAWGLLVDRFGERLVMAVGLWLAAATLVVAANTHSAGALVATLVGAGAAASCVMAATGRAVAGWFDDNQRGFALGVRQTGVPVGGALAAVTLPPIASAGGVDAAFYFLAGVSLLAGVLGALGLREPEGHELVSQAPSLQGSPLRDSRIWAVSGGGALLACSQSALVGFTVLFLHSERGLSIGSAAAVLACSQLLGTTGRVALGFLSDRYGDRLRPLVALGVASSITLALVAALTHAPLGVLIPALVVAGGIAMSWNALAFTATVELAGRLRSGAALGLQQSALGVVTAFMPIAFAPLVAASSWSFAFAIVATLPLAGAFVFQPLAREFRPAIRPHL